MLVPLRAILEATENYHYAQGAFNVNAVAQAQAAIEVHEMFRSAAILQGADLANGFMGGRTDFMNATLEDKIKGAANIGAAVKKYGEDSPIPVALHLDHGRNFESCKAAIAGGYTSVMIDGSKLPLEENIALTYKVSEMCAAVDVPVEGEIGRVGGKEDDLESDGGYTIPEEAVRFEKESGLFSMAVGVGTAHGFYKEKPQLNKELITTLRGMLQAPMVLHGASGLSDEDVKDCIRRGICKVNFATELRAAYTEGVKAVLAENPKTFDPKAYGKEARQRVKALVMERMLVCGCDGKA